jgi:hypothetical protein
MAKTLDEYLRRFPGYWATASEEEVRGYDEAFMEGVSEIGRFYGIDPDRMTAEQRAKYRDLLYKVGFVKMKTNEPWDERYDQPLFNEMLKRIGYREEYEEEEGEEGKYYVWRVEYRYTVDVIAPSRDEAEESAAEEIRKEFDAYPEDLGLEVVRVKRRRRATEEEVETGEISGEEEEHW